jgi:hypothetical protein
LVFTSHALAARAGGLAPRIDRLLESRLPAELFVLRACVVLPRTQKDTTTAASSNSSSACVVTTRAFLRPWNRTCTIRSSINLCLSSEAPPRGTVGHGHGSSEGALQPVIPTTLPLPLRMGSDISIYSISCQKYSSSYFIVLQLQWHKRRYE